jgi:selenocysteine-specific elongation factor
MRVIGTAGHVDHGKSTLIAALTGVHPDRLKEEQEREMTIDLGFGWLTLPDGEQVGIVDVPGHRDFIENMLAGVGGIDAVLLVIAADEGIMPQTREHLAILDLLAIPTGIIVFTKVDLTPDPSWLALLENDVRSLVLGTALQDAPCVRVSARSREGLDELVSVLSQILKDRPGRLDLGRPRLPIDRVFSMPGFGTVVTGTLLDGSLNTGDEIELLPTGLSGRVRGIQTHKNKVDKVIPGSRTAVNITGADTSQIQRGNVLTCKNQYEPSSRLDARVRLLKESSKPLKHATDIKFFVGTSESLASVRLLDAEMLLPGQEGFIQLNLRQSVVAVRGDKFILRRPSPAETIGGGVIVDHQPSKRHKRFDTKLLGSLTALVQGSPADILMEAVRSLQTATVREIIDRSRLAPEIAQEQLPELVASGALVAFGQNLRELTDGDLIMSKTEWQSLASRTGELIQAYHQDHPLRRGVPREELKNRLNMDARRFNPLLVSLISAGLLAESDGHISISDRSIQFNADQKTKVELLFQKFSEHPFNPPGAKECIAEVGEELFHALIGRGDLIRVSAEIVLRRIDYDSMVAKVKSDILERGRITLAEVRDEFLTSRKYAQALLEHLDAQGLTVRDGDYRKMK